MRIGIDASRANVRERTGTERYSYHIITEMVAIDRSIRFTLYVDRQPLPEISNLGPNVDIKVLKWPFGFLWSQLRLSWEMFRNPPDVMFVPAHTMPIVHPRRTVTTIHDLGFEHDRSLYDSRRIGGPGLVGALLNIAARVATFGKFGNSELDYHRWSARFAASRASHLITVSDFTRRDIIRRYGVSNNSITVIYHGFDRALFMRPANSAIQSVQKSLAVIPPYILFIGRLEKKKNILDLIRAFERSRGAIQTLSLVLVGRPGLGWDEARAYIERHDLGAHVRELGWQPNEVSIPLMAGASAVALLSEFEGFGMPLLESFSVGTPVIAARRAAIPEVAGEAARLVDPHDIDAVSREIVTVVTDEQVRAACIDRGLKRVVGFTWQRAARLTLSVLRSDRTS